MCVCVWKGSIGDGQHLNAFSRLSYLFHWFASGCRSLHSVCLSSPSAQWSGSVDWTLREGSTRPNKVKTKQRNWYARRDSRSNSRVFTQEWPVWEEAKTYFHKSSAESEFQRWLCLRISLSLCLSSVVKKKDQTIWNYMKVRSSPCYPILSNHFLLCLAHTHTHTRTHTHTHTHTHYIPLDILLYALESFVLHKRKDHVKKYPFFPQNSLLCTEHEAGSTVEPLCHSVQKSKLKVNILKRSFKDLLGTNRCIILWIIFWSINLLAK